MEGFPIHLVSLWPKIVGIARHKGALHSGRKVVGYACKSALIDNP
jgi:hypothetical protein